MVHEFELPDLGKGVTEGEILEWHVAPGDRIAEDDVLAEVETDKAAVDVSATVDGTVAELRADVGDAVEEGDVVAVIDEGDGPDDESAPETSVDGESDGEEAASATSGRVFAPPNVRRLARELGVEITDVAGSGPSGRITEGDVRSVAESGESGEEDDAEETAAESEETELKSAVSRVGEGTGDADADGGEDERVDGATDAGDAPKSAIQRVGEPSLESDAETTGDPAEPGAVNGAEGTADESADESGETELKSAVSRVGEASDGETTTGDEGAQTVVEAPGPTRREPYDGARRTVGERMARSRREVPHATHHEQVAVAELVEARERLRPLAEERDVRLTPLPFVLKSVAAALRDHPVVNSELDDEAEEVVYKQFYDLGVATTSGEGRVAPVVGRVGEKGVLELASEVNGLLARARVGSLDRTQRRGGTFTVTDLGAVGDEHVDPVIDAPQTAILAVGALERRPVVRDGEVVAEPTLPLSLAVDRRVIDGADAAAFLDALTEYLEDPTRLLLE